VSTEEQTQNFSIENQLECLEKYCADKSYDIVDKYVDAGFSGTTLKRPAFTRLMEDVETGDIDIVLVYKLDRLFRSSRHLYNVLHKWEKSGVAFTSVTESFETTTAMGKAHLGMASTFAELERNTFMERSREGTRRAVQKGHYSGGIVAYGYKYNQDTKHVEINESEAKIVRQMYHLLNEENMTTYSIAGRLNLLGIPTRYAKDGRGIRGKATANKWRPGRIYNMLRNTAYKGEWTYGKRSKTRKGSPITVECPPIIDTATFDIAQRRLRENSLRSDRNSERVYPLRGLVKCEICGHSYCGGAYNTKNGEVRYYRCTRGGMRGGELNEGCLSLTVLAEPLEDLVWEHISNFIRRPKTVKKMLAKCKNRKKGGGLEVELSHAEQRLEELFEAEKRLLRLYAEPNSPVTKEALDSQVREIVNQRELLKKHLNELRETNIMEIERDQKLDSMSPDGNSGHQIIHAASCPV